jgi:hypothetical protein
MVAPRIATGMHGLSSAWHKYTERVVLPAVVLQRLAGLCRTGLDGMQQQPDALVCLRQAVPLHWSYVVYTESRKPLDSPYWSLLPTGCCAFKQATCCVLGVLIRLQRAPMVYLPNTRQRLFCAAGNNSAVSCCGRGAMGGLAELQPTRLGQLH